MERSMIVIDCGLFRREDVGISNEINVKNIYTE